MIHRMFPLHSTTQKLNATFDKALTVGAGLNFTATFSITESNS